jgi:hypothetical protein
MMKQATYSQEAVDALAEAAMEHARRLQESAQMADDRSAEIVEREAQRWAALVEQVRQTHSR